MNLKRIEVKDHSSITVNYERYVLNSWVYSTVEFKSEIEYNAFIKIINKDFNQRIISVEKRTIIYERFE